MPLASILIPVYNHEKFIARAVVSALNQTIKDIEVVIVDNKSTDGTFEICKRLAATDGRIVLAQNEENIGPVRNWKKTVGLATANFSKLLFSDDYLHPQFLEKTLPYLADPKCAFVYSTVNIGTESSWVNKYRAFIGDTKIIKETYIWMQIFFAGTLLPYSPCACIGRTSDLKTNLVTHLPGHEKVHFEETGAGVDWIYQPLTAANPNYDYVQYLEEPIVFFGAHETNLSSNPIVDELYQKARAFLRGNMDDLASGFDILASVRGVE